MKCSTLLFAISLLLSSNSFAQSPSFQTYINPVIPGDHPDPTLTKIGNDFYTSGSSFNPTPKIYHSTDLVHWQVIAQPVTPDWAGYGNSPGGGIWGGHMVLYNNTYWHFFGKGGSSMYFVTAELPEGPWSFPTQVNVPAQINSLGVDNSIFIDEDTGKWYMLAKHGRENNHIVELGNDGQPNGNVLDLTWINPEAEDFPYGWAEGPVMWKYKGTYYYSFAQHLAGYQYVIKSDTLSDNPDDWSFKPGPMQYGSPSLFRTPNHISPAIMLDDSTSWAIGHSYHTDWVTQGRQGLLLQITYDEDGFPQFEYPKTTATTAPNLPNGQIPWMVPKSDMFTSEALKPEWSFLGDIPLRTQSLTERPGWLMLEPGRQSHTLIQNDGEHHYSIVTRLDFEPTSVSHQAGLYIINGPENLQAKVYSTVTEEGAAVFKFTFDDQEYEAANTIGNIAWLKLERYGHTLYGYYSENGDRWRRIGGSIDANELNVEQTDFNSFTGNQQGLFANAEVAYFDLYVYRDAYSRIAAQSPSNYSGVTKTDDYLGNISNNDWALYAGVEFGNEQPPAAGFDYQRTPEKVNIEMASNGGGTIELWADSINTGTKIAQATIPNTGNLSSFISISTEVDSINGQHDVYVLFKDVGEGEGVRLKELRFRPRRVPIATANKYESHDVPTTISLDQNYPNPFNPSTTIGFQLPSSTEVTLSIFDNLGRQIATLVDGVKAAGTYQVRFNASNLSSGLYYYRLSTPEFIETRKMLLLK